MIQQDLQYAQIVAGADFSPSEVAAIRAEDMAQFEKEPAQQTQAYQSEATLLKRRPPDILSGKRGWLDLSFIRYWHWQGVAQSPEWLRHAQDNVARSTILKYNPVLVNSGGMLVTQRDIDSQFDSDALVAQAAGLAPPTQAEKAQFITSLPSRFTSMSKEEKQRLTGAELRLANFDNVFKNSIKTRAAIIADIRRNVHSSRDVSREARQLEWDTGPLEKYGQSYQSELTGAILGANRTRGIQTQMKGKYPTNNGIH